MMHLGHTADANQSQLSQLGPTHLQGIFRFGDEPLSIGKLLQSKQSEHETSHIPIHVHVDNILNFGHPSSLCSPVITTRSLHNSRNLSSMTKPRDEFCQFD